MSTPVRYPDIVVELVGQDGNAAMILGLVRKALRANGVPRSEVAAFMDEATSGDYDELLATTTRWVTVS